MGTLRREDLSCGLPVYRHLPKLTPEELAEMKKLNPKTDADRAEEQQEEEFLNGGERPKPPARNTHRH